MEKFLVIVLEKPLPETVWTTDVDEDGRQIFIPTYHALQYSGHCGFKTMSYQDILHHLDYVHFISDLDQVDFYTPYVYRENLPKDAKILSGEEETM